MAAGLGGCSTFSFAPPAVEVDSAAVSRNGYGCRTEVVAPRERIGRDVPGAAVLIDNFVTAYRCAAHEAADGRQIFEVPSFLALVTAAVGSTFGLSADGSLAAAGGAAVYGRANGYYAPKQKAKLLDSAIDAVLCIKAEAVGVDFFDTTKPAPAPASEIAATRQALQDVEQSIDALAADREALIGSSGGGRAPAGEEGRSDVLADADVRPLAARYAEVQARITQFRSQARSLTERLARMQASAPKKLMLSTDLPNGDVVQIDVGRVYFEMVSAALMSVERILAQRLSDTGSFDAAGLSAELEKLTKERADAQAKKEAVSSKTNGFLDDWDLSAKDAAAAQAQELIKLDLKLLQPKLQTCIVRAKL